MAAAASMFRSVVSLLTADALLKMHATEAWYHVGANVSNQPEGPGSARQQQAD